VVVRIHDPVPKPGKVSVAAPVVTVVKIVSDGATGKRTVGKGVATVVVDRFEDLNNHPGQKCQSVRTDQGRTANMVNPVNIVSTECP